MNTYHDRGRFRALLLVTAILLGGLLALSASSRLQAEEPDAVGWERAGFQFIGGNVGHSSPTIADITGDGIPEVIVGTRRVNGATGAFDRPGMLAVFRADGSLLWQRDLNGPINSSATVADIDRDGQMDIVIGVGGDTMDMAAHGGVYALDHHGTIKWFFKTRDFAFRDGYSDGVFSSPTLCDVNNDGYLETIFGSWDHWIYLLNHQGHSMWHDLPNNLPGPGYHNADTVWSSPACADLNNDGNAEIIIGADISKGGILPDGTVPDDGGYLFVFNRYGHPLVRRYVPEAIYSSVAVGDLNRDGRLELVVGTSTSFWSQGIRPQPFVYAFSTQNLFNGSLHYSDPNKLPDLPGWPQPTIYPGFSSPALADLDNDGDLEIVIGSGKPYGASDQCSNHGGDPNCYGALYAWHHNGALVNGFPMWPKDYMNKNSGVSSSPAIADVDNNGTPEIVISMLWDVIVISNTGQQQSNLNTRWSVNASPAIADTDRDGRAEVWIGGSHMDNPSNATMWRFEATDAAMGRASWMQFRSTAAHLGAFRVPPHMTASPMHLIHNPTWGVTAHGGAYVDISNNEAVRWQVLSVPNRIMVLSAPGIATDGFTVQFAVNTGGLPNGTHVVGSIRIGGTDVATGQSITPVDVPVTLIVGPAHRLHAPLVILR